VDKRLFFNRDRMLALLQPCGWHPGEGRREKGTTSAHRRFLWITKMLFFIHAQVYPQAVHFLIGTGKKTDEKKAPEGAFGAKAGP
jgi:hypothetical protein